LLAWYDAHHRRLPWRAAPGEAPTDPYRVWLSEIMLQQTTVKAVGPYFRRFLESWPTIEHLAAADEHAIMAAWAGLGYYARARNLIACARAVAALGGFPTTAAELRQLPGIGAYTSAAIAAIAFGEKAPAVDTNVERVIARLHALAAPPRERLERELLAMMEDQHPGDVVQALMDLGATICRPKGPRCSECPLRGDCAAYASGEPERFPARRERKARPRRYGVAWWTERDGCLWLVRRPAKGLLGGMAALPGSEWTDSPPDRGKAVGAVRHVFTHFSLELSVESRPEPASEGWWHPVERLGEAGLPTLYLKAVEDVLRGRHSLAA
jgi:A/G-specific adenine glycosylase